jgi:NAD(P)-dependent dehydrogenase (short-subunit alcohol dehydrogenase family)
MRLRDKVAIVTGSTGGIGLAIALLFAQEGARVVVNGRSEGRGQETIQLIKAKGGEAIFVAGDVSRADTARSLVMAAGETYGKLDILVNNAGLTKYRGSVVELSEEEWDAMIDVNLKAAFLCSKYAIPEMVRASGGSIIHVSSGAGLIGRPKAAAYCAAKAGLILLTKNMALDFAPQKIMVNCVCPGGVDTPALQNRFAMQSNPDEARQAYAEMHPLGIGRPEDVAYAILYLASDEASWVTGSVIVVDGGVTAGRS